MPVRRAVVTGAANGIGRVLAQAYAARGWQVTLLDEDENTGTWVASRLRARKLKAEFLATDLSAEPDIRKAVKKIAAGGKVEVLINNAGIGDGHPMAERSLEQWNHVLAVNLTAPYLMVKHLLPHFSRPAAVVNIASTRALMSEPDTEPYSASKGGILSLTHSLAVSLQGKSIRVNAISPGWIDVSHLHGKKSTPAKLNRRDHEQHPAGRVGRPEDIAEACLFLTDQDKAGFITGANLVVDGGMTRKMIYE